MKQLKILIACLCFSHFGFAQPPTDESPSEEPVVVKEMDSTSIEVPYSIIEQVPVYPGCENNASNRDLKDCMTNKIRKHVAKKFNTDLGDSLGLSGRQRIIAMFKIDKEGYVIDVKARAAHPALEAEAKRVVELMPKMAKPGFQRGKPVIVPYSLPIQFFVQEERKLSKKELRRLKREERLNKVKKKN